MSTTSFAKFKNLTPRQIAVLSAVWTALVIAVAFPIILYTADRIWLATIVASGLGFIAAYGSFVYFLRNYIYRRIKLIYKTIHQQKLSPSEKKNTVDINDHIIDQVEQEVEGWVNERQREIDRYRNWAEYRRRFVGDISHELKTPIFNIQGYLHSLIDGGLHDEKINMSFLQKAAKNVERLHTIVEDLGAISRLESGELALDLQHFDIKELAEEVFEELEFKAEEKSIGFQFKGGASAGYRVRADREYIRQVLTNLVNNSIKYGKPGGVTKIGFYDMDNYILVEVADNGIGIPQEHINHVFDRFYRVDKSRSRQQGGSGLGLSIVKHIIEAHQQTINVRSRENLGSTFGFTLEKAAL